MVLILSLVDLALRHSNQKLKPLNFKNEITAEQSLNLILFYESRFDTPNGI